MGKSTISMVIFNSYVSLPEGIPPNIYGDVIGFDPKSWHPGDGQRSGTVRSHPGCHGRSRRGKWKVRAQVCHLGLGQNWVLQWHWMDNSHSF